MSSIDVYRSYVVVSLSLLTFTVSASLTARAQDNDLQTEISQTWEDGEWTHDARDIYEYTDRENERWITRTHQTWNDTTDAWDDVWESVSISNEYGILVDEKTYVWQDSSWVKYSDMNYQHNSKGRTTEWLRRKWNGSEWANDYRKIHEYDTLVTRSSTVEQTWSDGSWSDVRRVTYRYDEDAKLTEKQVETAENGTWENAELTSYTYDEHGKTLETTVRVWTNDSWVNESKNMRSYEDGNLTEELRQQWSDGTWTDQSLVTHVYSEQGEEVRTVTETYDDGSWVKNSRSQYIYEEETPVQQRAEMPDSYSLDHNYPNPFNPSTTISYSLPEPSRVQLHVYDVLGKRVATLVDMRRAAGQYTVEWQADDMPSGTYLYRLVAGEFSRTRTMVLVK